MGWDTAPNFKRTTPDEIRRYEENMAEQAEEEERAELESTNIRLPVTYKRAVAEAGINLSDLVRRAIRRELKRRGIKVEEPPKIKRGRPRKPKTTDTDAG